MPTPPNMGLRVKPCCRHAEGSAEGNIVDSMGRAWQRGEYEGQQVRHNRREAGVSLAARLINAGDEELRLGRADLLLCAAQQPCAERQRLQSGRSKHRVISSAGDFATRRMLTNN